MTGLSENYYLRKCYMQQEQVPTQSMIKKKMTPPLAAVYFNSMNQKLKVLAGLEPSLKGGGSDWFVHPEDVLKGRAVLKPVKKKILDKLNHHGIESIGTAVFERHRKALRVEKENELFQHDLKWRDIVSEASQLEWANLALIAKKKNTEHLHNDVNHFAYLYRESLGKIESLFHESAIAEIKNTREMVLQAMQKKYATVLKYQAKTLYDLYDKKLKEEKARLKAEFVHQLDVSNKTLSDKLHDINVDKHAAIEKLRQFFKCQNLACAIYVALKEREETTKTFEEMNKEHTKKVRKMGDLIVLKELEIHFAEQKEKKRQEFYNVWQKKVCVFVKNFQRFVSYCLNTLPDHAEFFINMEKLMLLQISNALEDASAESIIAVEREEFHTPIPQPVPFYLFCDSGYKAEVNQELCPKRVSSSPSQLPAIVINRQCLYAACDNFNEFNKKMKDFLHGSRGDDADFTDDLIYEHFVPVTYRSAQQLVEMKLESSLLQILHQEIANMTDKNTPEDACSYCKLPWCSCATAVIKEPPKIELPSTSTSSSESLSHDILWNRSTEKDHEGEPKWESFCSYVKPKKCDCAKMARKHLVENLPVYMRQVRYGPPEIPYYEMCPTTTLKALVEEAKKRRPRVPAKIPSKTNADMSTQCLDQEFETLCTCFSSSEVDSLLRNLNIDPKMFDSSWTNIREASGKASLSYIKQRASSFATARALSLRNLVEGLPELKDIFKRSDCVFE